MKKILLAFDGSHFSEGAFEFASRINEQMKAQVMKTYTCDMHPDVALDKEGKCPKCGKALIEKKAGQ